ncbi:helix-turn-helix domain-containing protein [Pseudomonas aeruginosa]|uniref:helix-turn-helix domain-containing protein n=1 Tax=Pseudomonas aeruginosa TaxID=287 RepID=UPI003D7C1A32
MTPFRKQLGSNLKNIRELAGLNQAELAERVGCSVNIISRYESGKNSPGIELLSLLAETLEVSPLDILPPTLHGKRTSSETTLYLRQEIIKKILDIQSLDKLNEILEFVDTP